MNMSNVTSSFIQRLRSGASLDPARDWLVLCTLSAIALIGIIVWNVWTFNTIANGGVIGIPATGASSAFSRSSLDTVHTIFATRAAEESKYATGVYRYADPSQ